MNSYDRLLKLDIKKIPPGGEYPGVGGAGAPRSCTFICVWYLAHAFFYIFLPKIDGQRRA
jgi:hypothetical protein